MRSKRIIITTSLLVTVVLCVAYFASPRSVVVDTHVGTPAGVQVSLIQDVSGVLTVSTDSRGVAVFGRGPWSPLFGKKRIVSLKVERDGKTLWEGLVMGAPRLGAIHISVP